MNRLETMNAVSLGRVKRLIEQISKEFPDNDEIELSFELIIGSLFPEALDNMKEALAQSYIDGYKAGSTQ